MIGTSTAILWLGIAQSAQGAPEIPAAWQQKLEAAVKAQKSGRTAEAEALIKQVVSEAEKLGPDDLRLAEPLERLAGFYIGSNNREHLREAEALLLRSLTIREKFQGATHPDVANLLANLGVCQVIATGKSDLAILNTLQRALTIFETSKGKDGPEVARVLTLLSVAHMQRGDVEAAESALTRAVAIREKTFGTESPKLAASLDDLGDVHALRARDSANEAIVEREGKQAESLYQRALKIREKTLNPDDPAIAESVHNLGQLAAVLDRAKDSVPYFERWLALRQKGNAPESEDQGKALSWLAEAAIERKDLDEAERLLARTQAVFERVKGINCDEVLQTLSMRFDAALEAGRFDEAERLIKRSMDLQSKKVSAQDPVVADARSLMATSDKDHTRDRRAPVLWSRLDAFWKQNMGTSARGSVAEIVSCYAKLLRRTNVVVPQLTALDLAYLKKREFIIPSFTLDLLAKMSASEMFPVSLNDEALSHLGRLYDTKDLYADVGSSVTAPITDKGLSGIRNLINLRTLSLEGSRITDAGLSNLVELKDLEYLRLSGAPIGDAGLRHLKGLTKLQELRLDGTNVTDKVLEQLKAMDSLLVLDLRRTKVSQDGFDRLKRARPNISIKHPADDSEIRPTRPADPDVPSIKPSRVFLKSAVAHQPVVV
jgi:tetratricopeptide (TPR) repeat protein